MLSHRSGWIKAEETAAANMNAIAERFEQVNAATLAEIKALRNELARAHAIEEALMAERADVRWLS